MLLKKTSGYYRSFYHILDVGISLESDSEEFLELFDRDYSWFRTGAARATRMLLCRIDLNGDDKSPCVRINDRLFPVKGHPKPASYAFQIILRELFENTRDFILLHAGVVAKEGKALIISGPPGAGKTTLTLKILERGFTFLSDDFCPIHKRTKLVHPFPRSIWISKESPCIGTSVLSRLNQAPDSASIKVLKKRSLVAGNNWHISVLDRQQRTTGNNGGISLLDRESPAARDKRKNRGGKSPISPEKTGYPVADRPCPARCLIFLDTGDGQENTCRIEIGLKEEARDGFIKELMNINKFININQEAEDGHSPGGFPNIIDLEVTGDEPFSGLIIKYNRGMGFDQKIRYLVSKYSNRIWNIYRADDVCPDFSKEPLLTPMPNHRAAFHLLSGLRQDIKHNNSDTVSAVRYQDSPGRFFMEINGLLEGVPCYRLSAGRLDAMKDMVLSLV
ncbi:hypothetical protein JXL19_00770 [bacterium]|nr:hypothetical protein [bacterium]